MPDIEMFQATTRVCIEFQESSASAAAEARLWIDGCDRYEPRVIGAQKIAAMYATEARIRLFRLIGVE